MQAFRQSSFSTCIVSANPEEADPAGALTRFIASSGQVSAPHAKPKAFEPKFDQERQRSETSVFRTDSLAAHAVWDIVACEFDATRANLTRWRAVVQAESVTALQLLVTDDVPPDRHAVIVGWPEGPDRKQERISLQQLLAAEAKLELRP